MGLPLVPLTHLECQLYEDDAPGQCPLQVVGGDWRAGTLKKKKMWVQWEVQGFPNLEPTGRKTPPPVLGCRTS